MPGYDLRRFEGQSDAVPPPVLRHGMEDSGWTATRCTAILPVSRRLADRWVAFIMTRLTRALSMHRAFSLGIAVQVAAVACASGVTTLASAAKVEVAPGPVYSATLTASAGQRLAVFGGVTWTCEGTGCRATEAGADALKACRALARGIGQVAVFKAGDDRLSPGDLRKCNPRDVPLQRVFPPSAAVPPAS